MSEHEETASAADGRIGADRMAMGLVCIPSRSRGDMLVVRALQAKIAELDATAERLTKDKERLLTFSSGFMDAADKGLLVGSTCPDDYKFTLTVSITAAEVRLLRNAITEARKP